MRQLSETPRTVDEYIARCAPEIQAKLHAVRIEARSNAPQAHEKIGYGIPTLTMGKNIFHFAAFKNHIGLYPGPVALEVFSDELKSYKTSKGAIQIPLNQPIPRSLVAACSVQRRKYRHRGKEMPLFMSKLAIKTR